MLGRKFSFFYLKFDYSVWLLKWNPGARAKFLCYFSVESRHAVHFGQITRFSWLLRLMGAQRVWLISNAARVALKPRGLRPAWGKSISEKSAYNTSVNPPTPPLWPFFLPTLSLSLIRNNIKRKLASTSASGSPKQTHTHTAAHMNTRRGQKCLSVHFDIVHLQSVQLPA